MGVMKAVRLHEYGGPEQLHFEDAQSPEPAAGQVLVRVHAASVNPWDYKLASGAFRDDIPLKLPYIPGGDFSGVVEAAAPDVSGLTVGQAVYGNCPRGAWAQFLAVSDRTIAPKPQKLSHVEAASVPVAGQTAWQALFDHGHLERGQTVLIHAAAGGVGTFAVQLARWKGARVLATASAANAEYLRSLGADEVIDYKATPFESVAREVDVVLDLLGGQTQARSFAVVKRGGYLVSTVQPPPPLASAQRGIHASMMSMEPSTAGLNQLAALLDDGAIRAVVTATYPLAQAAEALAAVKSGHSRGKIVLEVP